MTQTREKWHPLVLSRTDFWMVWRCHCIPCFHFIFLFRINGKKEHWHYNDVRDCYGNFSKVLCSKFFLSNYEEYWKIFERYLKVWKTPYSWRFYGHASTYVLILSWVTMKRKSTKVTGKLSVPQKSESVLRRTLHHK